MTTTKIELVEKEDVQLRVPEGKVATTVLTLYREGSSPYDGPWTAAAYSVFSNANGTVVFLSKENAAAEPEWNEVTKRFESKVQAESISVGSDYNVPAGAITSILSTDLVGFTGVVNEEPASGGQDPTQGTVKQ